MKRLIFICLALLTSGLTPALGQLTIRGDEARRDLYKAALLVSPGSDKYTLEEVRRWPDSLFRPLENSHENLGFTRGYHWLKFELNYQGKQKETYLLRTARPITDSVILYQLEEDGTQKTYYSGDKVARQDRQNNQRASVFELQLEPGKTYTYYLHLHSDGEMLGLPLSLSKPLAYAKKEGQTQMFFGIFYGMVLLAAMVYLIFYRGMRDRSFLFYGIYVLSIGLLQFSLDGYVRTFWFPEGAWIASHAVLLSAYLSMVFLGLYSESFLQIRRYIPRMRWLYRGIYGLASALLLLMISGPEGLALTYPLINVLGLLLLGLIFASVIMLRWQNRKVDVFYTIGVSFLVFTLVVFILNNIGLLPNNFLTVHSSKIGATLEVVFLSISMTNRIRKLKSEKQRSQALALERSQQMNDVKNYFMSNMSHELRTPLNAILGLVNQMLEGKSSESERKQNLEVIRYSSTNLLSSVNDILDFSKMERGQITLASKDFDPEEVLSAIGANWATIARQKGLEFSTQWDPSIPKTLKGDPDRLGQIANNLLSNAVKFTHTGKVTFIVGFETLQENQVQLKLKICDTGVGIKADKQKQIFDHFWQNNLSHKRQFGGLGLGLSIVSELVNLQKGTIELDSQEESGTVVAVALPLTVVTTDQPEQTQPKSKKPLQEAKLLIVEDNALNQLVLKKMLDKWEKTTYEVAENGQVALEKLGQDAFDLILMDLQMPVMDGYEATERIKNAEAGKKHAQIPIVAVTADAMEETRQKVMKLGMEAYLTKPVSNDELHRTVTLLLHDRQQEEVA